MNDPDSGDAWLTRLVNDLERAPAGGWPGVVNRYAATDPARLGEVLETAAVLAAAHAAEPARPAADAAGWRAVVAGLAAAYPAHAPGVRECAGLLTAVAGHRPPADPSGVRRLRTGARLGPFVVTGFVGAGGMGEVYTAVQDGLARTVALKVVRGAAVGPLARARFDRERLVLAKLHQSNIVPVYYAGADGDLQFYAMQYVPGAPLHRVVSVVRARATTAPHTGHTPPLREVVDSILNTPPDPAPPAETVSDAPPAAVPAVRLSWHYFRYAAEALAQVAEAVHHGHEKGVLHRDLKPSNLLVDARGMCWVIDYGLARAAGDGPAPPGGDADDVLTRGGVGTPQYMAPEQFDGKADARSDVWGLGATLYELLTLRPAFAGGRWADVERRVRAEYPAAANRVVPTVPRDLAAVCRKALAKNPADRYPTAAAFGADLRRWLRWEPVAARPAWLTLRPLRLWACRNVGWAAALLLVAAGLVAAAVVATTQADQERRTRAFVTVLGEAEELRRRRPFAGWSSAVRAKLDAARRHRPDAPLADAYAATLTGPDALRVRLFELPEERAAKFTGFTGVAFGPDGRLACAGHDLWLSNRHDRTPAMVFDANPAREPMRAGRAGAGPVAFAAGVPLQLILPPAGGRTLTLWNLALDRAVAEIELPPEPARVEELVAALAPDGRRAAASLTGVPDATGKRAGVTVVWDVDLAKPAARLCAWDAPASALAFSPDGRLVAAGAADGGVTVRDAATGAGVAALGGERGPVLAVAFGRNFRADATGPAAQSGPLVAAGYDAGNAVVWDLGTKARVSTCRGASHYVNALAFTPDGAALVTAGHFTPVVWDVATGQPLFDLAAGPNEYGNDGYLTGVAMSADGRRVAVVGTNQNGGKARLQVFEFDPDRGAGVYRGLAGQCRQVWLSPSAALVAGLSDNWQLAVWDRATGAVRRVWDVPRGWTTDNADVAFDEAAGAVYFAAGESACRLDLTGARGPVWRLRQGLNDNLLVRPGQLPLLARRESTGPLERDRPRPPTEIRVRELLPDGTAREKYAFTADFGPVEGTTLAAGGKYLVVHVREDRPGARTRLIDAATGRHLPLLEKLPVRVVESVRVSDDGTRLLARVVRGERVTTLVEYRLPELTEVRAVPNDPSFVYDDAGSVGATSSTVAGRAGLAVFRVGADRPLVTFDAGRQPVTPAKLSPDGRFAVWGRDDGAACVADITRSLERLADLTGR